MADGKARFVPKKAAAKVATATAEPAKPVAAPKKTAKQATPKAEKPAKEPKPAKPVAPAMTAEEWQKKQTKENPEQWKKVIRVTEASDKNRPLRVLIKCTDPQTDREGGKLCAGTREIAVQDLFQVHRCVPCQKRYLQLYRNKRSKNARTSSKKAAAAS